MEKWIENLLALQETDLSIRRITMRLEMLPKEKEKLEAELDTARQNLHDSKESTQKSGLEIKQVESEIKKFNDEIEKLQKQSIMVKKNDEYKALMSEIDGCKSKISDLETREINLLDEQDEANAAYKELEKNFAAKEKSVNEEIQELDELKTKLADQISKLKETRNQQKQDIDPEVLPVYERLLSTGKGQPLVPIHHGSCGNCHLKLTPQTINESRKATKVHCDNCGNLIYFVEE